MADMGGPAQLVGGGIVNLLTTGTYNCPLSIFREYVQNAADAVSYSGNEEPGRIEIELDAPNMRIRVRDNGPGLPKEDALRALLPIGRSSKRRGTDRGFRGIGRLSGLAFAETVTFLTRAKSSDAVSRIIWNGPKLRESAFTTQQFDRAVRDAVVADTVAGDGYPDHFFEVEVSGVARHAAGLMLNQDAVRAYIAEVCPVPLASAFPFAAEFDALFRGNSSPLTLEIVVGEDETPVTRRYQDIIYFSDTRRDEFSQFEEIHIPSVDGIGSAAVGWIAHSSYLGAIPKETGIRGIRAREGNIQIGDDAVFDHLFPEERFNKWCIGEVHIQDPRIVPNARWDYFELGPHTRNLENHLAAALHRIATRCRKASSIRNRSRRAFAAVEKLEDTYELAASGYLASDVAKAMIERATSEVDAIRQGLDVAGRYAESRIGELTDVETKLRNFKAKRGRPPFGDMSRQEIEVCRRIFHALTLATNSPRLAKETIESVLTHA